MQLDRHASDTIIFVVLKLNYKMTLARYAMHTPNQTPICGLATLPAANNTITHLHEGRTPTRKACKGVPLQLIFFDGSSVDKCGYNRELSKSVKQAQRLDGLSKRVWKFVRREACRDVP